MSVVIFSRAAGQVVSFSDPAAPAQAAVKLEGWGGFSTLKSLITRVGIGGQCNYQFLHTLGGDIFVYSFGDRVGRLIVSGLSFDGGCGGANDGLLGIEQVLRYYNQNRLAVRRTPIKLTIGTATTLKGYLDSINADATDPTSRIWEFQLHIALVPEPLKRISGGAPAGGGAEEDEGEEALVSEPPRDDGSLTYGPFPPLDSGDMDDGGAVYVGPSTPITLPGWAQNQGPRTNLVYQHEVSQ